MAPYLLPSWWPVRASRTLSYLTEERQIANPADPKYPVRMPS